MARTTQVYIPDEFEDLVEEIRQIPGESISSYLLKSAQKNINGDLDLDFRKIIREELAPLLSVLKKIEDGRLVPAEGAEPVTDDEKAAINAFFSSATESFNG